MFQILTWTERCRAYFAATGHVLCGLHVNTDTGEERYVVLKTTSIPKAGNRKKAMA